MKYLSIGNDAKTVKGEKFGWLTGILYLAPAWLAGADTVCKFSTEGCRRVCLYSAGRGGFTNVQNARIRKTREFQANPQAFVAQLALDIAELIAKAKRQGKRAAVRLNGTSDILWEQYREQLMDAFPETVFYDYTKYPPILRQNLPANYTITYSYSEAPNAILYAQQWRERGANTAVVFFVNKEQGLPSTFHGAPVVDGDLSDLRFLDQSGVIVGLKVKGKARNDNGNGFVQSSRMQN